MESDEVVAPLVSKSQRKRDSAALQILAAELSQLSETQLESLQLPEGLRTEVVAARAIGKHGARKRQLKYVGGLMRNLDVTPIRDGLADLKKQSRTSSHLHRRAENWRERLIDEGDGALTELVEKYPHADRQLLRTYMRTAYKETENSRAPRTMRELYRYLRTLFETPQE